MLSMLANNLRCRRENKNNKTNKQKSFLQMQDLMVSCCLFWMPFYLYSIPTVPISGQMKHAKLFAIKNETQIVVFWCSGEWWIRKKTKIERKKKEKNKLNYFSLVITFFWMRWPFELVKVKRICGRLKFKIIERV